MSATTGVRAVANSLPVYSASPDGLIPLPMFYLVSICEGILMPHLQPLVTLCEQKGHKGPLSKSGKHSELEKAKTEFGPAIKFLATHGRPIFSPESPTIGTRISELERDRLSKLRNSIAHLNFRLEIVRTSIKNDPAFPKDPKQAVLFEALYHSFVGSLKIHNPHKGEVVDSTRSIVQWEGAIGKPVTKSSTAITFKDMRDFVGRVEAFAYSLAFAFMEAGSRFGSALVIDICQACKEGHVVFPASVAEVTCPACEKTYALPSRES